MLLAFAPPFAHHAELPLEAPVVAGERMADGLVTDAVITDEAIAEPVLFFVTVVQDAACGWLTMGQRQVRRNLNGMAKLMAATSVQDVVAGQAELVTESVTQFVQDGVRIMAAAQSAFRAAWQPA